MTETKAGLAARWATADFGDLRAENTKTGESGSLVLAVKKYQLVKGKLPERLRVYSKYEDTNLMADIMGEMVAEFEGWLPEVGYWTGILGWEIEMQ